MGTLMLFRIAGLLSMLIPIGWGIICIHTGVKNSDFGPVLGGLMFLIPSVIVFLLIIWDMLEQIMNDSSEVIDPNEHDPY